MSNWAKSVANRRKTCAKRVRIIGLLGANWQPCGMFPDALVLSQEMELPVDFAA
jgi:hypothetical protein